MNHLPWLRLLLFCSAALIIPSENTPAMAQQWHISNPPVLDSVPQYRPQESQHTSDKQSVVEPKPVIRKLPDLNPIDNEPAVTNSIPAVETEPNDFAVPTIPPATSAKPETLQASNDTLTTPGSTAKPHGLDFSIYRNRDVFPVDPRKPCNVCTHPPQVRAANRFDWPGRKGQPYRAQEPGGCLCGKKGCPKCNTASIYWPRPLSVICNRENPSCWTSPYGPQPKKRLTDALDHLAGFKLIPYQRTDNGHCGPDADPYGCLGESKYR